MKVFTRHWIGQIAALLSGASLTLAFAPFSYYPLAVLSPACLLFLWLKCTPYQALWRGWLYGVGLFGTGVYWVFISIHTYGNASIPLAAFITACFIAILAIFPALNGYVLNRFFPKNNSAKFFLAFPVTWVFLEWIRGVIFTGFPWLSLGYTQINSPLAGFAPFFSVYGVSLAVLLSSGLLITAIQQPRKARACFLIIVVIWLVGSELGTLKWTKPFKKPLQVTLVQGNIPQDVKWSDEIVLPTLTRYQDLSDAHWSSQLVIWPEAAIPIILQDALPFLEKMHHIAKQHHAALITGIPIKDETKNIYYNGVIALGLGSGAYLKHRLVPFGEYIPFPHVLNSLFKSILNIPLPDSRPSTMNAPLIEVNGFKIATFICYEIAFAEQVRRTDNASNIILTVSNDAWFGQSIAKAQHLEMARMRAFEMGRPVLFSSNDGITAMIDAEGQIIAAAPTLQAISLTHAVQATEGKTPWQQFSFAPLLIMMLLLLGIAILKR